MDRREFIASGVGGSLVLAGCLDDSRAGPASADGSDGESEDESVDSSDSQSVADTDDESTVDTDDKSATDTNDESDEQSGSNESIGPAETVERFAAGSADDDYARVLKTVHPDGPLWKALSPNIVDNVTYDVTSLEVLEETTDEAIVEVVWDISVLEEPESESKTEITLKDDHGWLIWRIGDEKSTATGEKRPTSESVRAGLSIDESWNVDGPDVATIKLTQKANSDGIYVASDDGDPGACAEGITDVGDTCEVTIPGNYRVLAYAGATPDEAEAETVVNRFEVDE